MSVVKKLYDRIVRDGRDKTHIILVNRLDVGKVCLVHRAKDPRDYYVDGYPISISVDNDKYDGTTLLRNLSSALNDIGVDEDTIKVVLGDYSQKVLRQH